MLRYRLYKFLRTLHIISRARFKRVVPPGYKEIARSGLFDARWYMRQYPEVRKRTGNALRHYLLYGWLEGKSPGPAFNATEYLEAYPSVKASGMNPLLHFIHFGRFEGRTAGVDTHAANRTRRARFQSRFRHFSFTIIVPHLPDSEADLAQTLQSLTHQRYKYYEILVPDDGSQSGSLAQALAEHSDVVRPVAVTAGADNEQWVHEMLREARGEYVAFCECDCSWTKDHLYEVNNALNAHPNAEFAICDMAPAHNSPAAAALMSRLKQRRTALSSAGGTCSAELSRESDLIGSISSLCVSKILLDSCHPAPTNATLSWWLWRQLCVTARFCFIRKALTLCHTDTCLCELTTEPEARDAFLRASDNVVIRRAYDSVESHAKLHSNGAEAEKKASAPTGEQVRALSGLRVLYISTTSRINRPLLDPSVRYRCYHPAEMLNGRNLVSVVSTIQYLREPSYDYDVYIFHRPSVLCAEHIIRLREQGKVVIADYDDLIFGGEEVALCSSIVKNNNDTPERATEIFRNNLEALRLIDHFTVSTEPLARELQAVHPDAHVAVVHNFIPDSILALAERGRLREQPKNRKMLMYCSGTMSHNRDYPVAERAIMNTLARDKAMTLYLFGALTVENSMRTHPQIRLHPPVEYWQLFDHMAETAFTIAPLEHSRFNACKSNVKFLESALVGSTLLATDIPDMQRVGDAGIVLLSSAEAWEDTLAHIDTIDTSANIEKNYRYLTEHCAGSTFEREFAALINNL